VSVIDLLVPNLGDFKDVAVVDVLVAAGDALQVETPLITLETEKATLDVPSSAAGTLVELLVRRGDKVSQGSLIGRLETGPVATVAMPALPAQASEPRPAASGPTDTVRMPAFTETVVLAAAAGGPTRTATPASAPRGPVRAERSTQLLVLGAGPGGYTAAFRAADLGMRVTLVERWPTLGGVCLNVGCIPSKALLHAAKVVDDAAAMSAHGIVFGNPRIDLPRLRAWRSSIVRTLTGGLKMLAKQRKVEVVAGVGRFAGANSIEVTQGGVTEVIRFEQCIIAAGSEAARLPFIPSDPRVMDSTAALELEELPKRLLVIGGGIIGLEMACVYASLGSNVSVVELTAQLMPGCDADLVKPLEKRLRARFEQILLGTKVTAVQPGSGGLVVQFDQPAASAPQNFDRVLVAVGRTPNGRQLSAEAAGVRIDERGFLPVDRQQRTNVRHIFAIGDIAGPPMLAHKASHEGKVAAEVAAGHKSAFDARAIPSVAYTDPEVAWVGLTELQAKADGIAYQKGLFPWTASGRSLSLGRNDGFTKLLFDPQTRRLLGGGIVGPNAGDLIAEVGLAVEMGADAADIALTIHPHPTLSETVAFAAEAFEGTLTDLYVPKRTPGS
jgi:dihydrolipoamide dehydrogenase